MKVFIFAGGALVGAYFNTAVLMVASGCAEACTKVLHLVV
jgi:hypothetical protein